MAGVGDKEDEWIQGILDLVHKQTMEKVDGFFVKDVIGRKKIVNVKNKLVIERIVRKSVALHLPFLLDEPCIHQD